MLSASQASINAGQATGGTVPVDSDDLGGVVTGPNGPEAGVWVIAETADLPTKFAKIVVTDDRGRYLVPDLPKANYNVWVRGYGLVDSPKVQTAPGKTLNLTAVPAPNPRAAAEYYPAGYWFSLLEVPAKSEFPGTGAERQRHLAEHEEPGRVAPQLKSGGCTACHQLGHQGHARDPDGARHVPIVRRGVGSARAVRTGRRADERRPQQLRPRARAGDVRRLDRSDRRPARCRRRRRGRRASSATSSSRSGTGPTRRPTCTTSVSTDRRNPTRQRQRPDLRRARAERRLPAGARSGAPHASARCR